MKAIAKKLLEIVIEYNKSDGINTYNPIYAIRTISAKEGHEYWRLVQIRNSYKTKEVMITVVCTKDVLTTEQDKKIKDSLRLNFPLNEMIEDHNLV